MKEVKSMANYNEFEEIGYEGTISEEGSEFVLLPDGDYDFTVSKVTRTRHEASQNLPACNEVDVELTVWGQTDKTTITERFFLVRKFEWKLSQFFLSIGLKKHGEQLVMRWNIEGSRGKCKVYIDRYKKQDGSDGQSNKIKKFYAYDDDVKTASAPVQQAYQQPPVQQYQQQTWQQPQQSSGWKSGTF